MCLGIKFSNISDEGVCSNQSGVNLRYEIIVILSRWKVGLKNKNVC